MRRLAMAAELVFRGGSVFHRERTSVGSRRGVEAAGSSRSATPRSTTWSDPAPRWSSSTGGC